MSPKVSSQGYGIDSNTLAMLQRDHGQVIQGKRRCAKIVISPIWQSGRGSRVLLGSILTFVQLQEYVCHHKQSETVFSYTAVGITFTWHAPYTPASIMKVYTETWLVCKKNRSPVTQLPIHMVSCPLQASALFGVWRSIWDELLVGRHAY
jgi:hypothetical protein